MAILGRGRATAKYPLLVRPLLALSKPVADSGTGTDALTATVTGVALAETGAATDVLTVVAAVTVADAGAGTDALLVLQTKVVAETGAGTDAALALQLRPVTDSGAFTDVGVVLTPPVIAVGGVLMGAPGIGLVILVNPGADPLGADDSLVVLNTSGAGLAVLDTAGAGLATVQT